ncbi:hypothetical protein IMCC26134_05250 [Verrucomicrobia bacterium IMCC26134]|nr:hypothetical protein IMCC26134_05250 [Verrucomicrobia bacterium IMCC26134]
MSYNQSGEAKRKMPNDELRVPNRLITISSLILPRSAFLVCIWFLAKNRNVDAKRGFRERRKTDNQLELAA